MTNPSTLHEEVISAPTEQDAVAVCIRYIEWWEATNGPVTELERLESIENIRQAWRIVQAFIDRPPMPEPYEPRRASEYLEAVAKHDALLIKIRARPKRWLADNGKR